MNAPKGPYRRPGIPTVAAAGGLLTACVVLVAHARHFDFLNDDAFISFRYAENLVRHGALNYNPGERVEGYTNFLWTVILAAVIALGGDPVDWSKAIGVACSVGNLLVLFSFSLLWGRTTNDPARGPVWAAVAPLLLALSSPFAAWSEGGLETGLFTFLATAAALRQLLELVEDGRAPWSAVMAALAAMTRPEGVLLFALLAAHRLAGRREGTPPRRRLAPFLRWAALFGVVLAPYWTWRWAYYGYPLPNTYYAKAGALLWDPGGRYVREFVSDTHAWLALPFLALAWREPPHGPKLGSLIALIVAAWTFYVAAAGGDFMGLHRFLVPVLPLLALAVQEGLASLWRRASSWWRRRTGRPPGTLEIAVGAAAVLGLLVGYAGHNRRLTDRSLQVGSRDGVDSIGWLKEFVVQTTAIGRHLASTYPPDTRIATTAAGAIPYYSRMPTVDLLGLSDLHIAHEVAATGGRPGHRRSPPEAYVLSRHPRVLIWHPWITAEPVIPSAADVRYWGDRGYVFRTARVPGLDPPYWSYLEARR